MKDPAFLFYPNDYLGGTLGLTFEQKGAYIDLLMMQFNRGHMTYDMIAQMLGHKTDVIWSALSDKFTVDENGLYYNARLEMEQTKRKSYSDSRRNNRTGVNQHTGKTKTKEKNGKPNSGHMTKHMEDENINEIINTVKHLFKKQYLNDSVYKTLETLLKEYTKKQIVDVVVWARNDTFWSTNFLSINKLNKSDKNGVKYIDVFIEKMNADNAKTKPTQSANGELIKYKRNPDGRGWETVTKSTTAYKFDLEMYGSDKIILLNGN